VYSDGVRVFGYDGILKNKKIEKKKKKKQNNYTKKY
jgi:hypothetical protein